MAFEVKKINPLDLQPRKAVGIELPFSSKNAFSSNYQTKDAIKNNLINYFLTGRGERYLNPMFGFGLRNELFENITEEKIDALDARAREAIEIYFPRVIPNEIKLVASEDRNTIGFYLSYSIAETGIRDELLINVAI